MIWCARIQGCCINRDQSKNHFIEEVSQKNIIKNLEEQLHEVPGPELSDNGDTLVTAEAMEDLCFEVHLDESSNNCDKGVYSTGKTAARKMRNGTVHSEHLPYFTSVGAVTRQAKRTKIEDHLQKQ